MPKEFRKFVRKSTKKLHKKKGDNSKAREKAIQAGLSPEVLEFVQQFLLEWHAKLSHKRPWAVAKEMMEEKEEERTLPSGMEREHFLWLCRFMARWHLRHAGKCDFMTGWSSGETSDDTSGEEAGPSYEEGEFVATDSDIDTGVPFQKKKKKNLKQIVSYQLLTLRMCT